ncbi:unnamed protein product [Danaus chrysippus]|uniref:(African queen) hypothetical protein n=1 Tax=Danaus chrysippus TaxID=151541 RepID=A0A8J2R671_9NEOP|nr:unnamed protein product [Danaus chrysippus]
MGVGLYTSINPAPGRLESSSLRSTRATPVWRVLVAGVGIAHFSRPKGVDGEVQQGPNSAGYIVEPVPRVTGEDLNGGKSGDNSCRYGPTSGGGKPQGRCTWILMEGSGSHQYCSEA